VATSPYLHLRETTQKPAATVGDKDQAMPGIHHVTAISGKADRNLAFYTRVLGMRFVKKTVNFDDPGTYHLYYGDEAGRPELHVVTTHERPPHA